jgi:hypothetical protein
MITRLHKCARTTPRVRAEIAASNEPIATLAQRYGVSPMTVLKWKHRTDFEDRPHTAHRLQTTLTPAQEMIVVELRKTLLLSLDDLLAVVRAFINPNVSRSGLHRCLHRHGVGKLQALRPQAAKPAHKPFAAYEPGFVHLDVKYLPQMADEPKRRYLFVAIDRATRWVFVQLKPAKTARAARAFLAALGIEHRLTRVRRPQAALNARTPMQAMKDWHRTHPHLFHKRPYDRPGCDTCPSSTGCADRSRNGRRICWPRIGSSAKAFSTPRQSAPAGLSTFPVGAIGRIPCGMC